MNIIFRNPGKDYSIESILLFQGEEQTPFWSEPLLYFYPQVDRQELEIQEPSAKREYLQKVFRTVYEESEDELERKVDLYNDHFRIYRHQIEDAFSDAFSLDAGPLFNDLTGNITLNPICPRFLRDCRFDIFFKNSERGALGLALHEVIHFFWFHVWNAHFGDTYDEYETPSLKWILSEMAVQPIMADPRLRSLNPYFPIENGGCVYPYFQNMVIEGTPILEYMDKLYNRNRITDFMEAAFSYCRTHENEIRHHIELSEKSI